MNIESNTPYIENFNLEFEKALVNFEKVKAHTLFENYLKFNGNTSNKFIDDIIVNVLSNIGTKWDKGELSLAQVYLSSKICEEIIESLLPQDSTFAKNSLKIAIVTLEDHHILGKRIISSTLHASGFNIIDYGHGATAEEIVDKVISDKIDILLVSVLMYPSALKVKLIREKLTKLNLKTKLLVGGAPFNFDQDLWKDVGADAMGKNASDAFEIINKWMEV